MQRAQQKHFITQISCLTKIECTSCRHLCRFLNGWDIFIVTKKACKEENPRMLEPVWCILSHARGAALQQGGTNSFHLPYESTRECKWKSVFQTIGISCVSALENGSLRKLTYKGTDQFRVFLEWFWGIQDLVFPIMIPVWSFKIISIALFWFSQSWHLIWDRLSTINVS